jgi:hypothetical protein
VSLARANFRRAVKSPRHAMSEAKNPPDARRESDSRSAYHAAGATRELATWMFASLNEAQTPQAVIAWWERRRLPFNLLVGAWGIFCLIVFFAAITTSGHLQQGEDAVEPLALVAAPFVINLLYTLGWIVEITYRSIEQDVSPAFGPRLLKLGFGLGLFLCAVPAVLWSGYRLLQWAGIAA